MRNARWTVLTAARNRAGAAFESDVLAAGRGLEVPATQPSQGTVTRADQRDRIRSLLEGLDEPVAVVARMRMEGATFAAIGSTLGITEEAARQRFLSASKKLRGRLDG